MWLRRTRHVAWLAPPDGPSATIPARSLLTGGVVELSPARLGLLLGLSATAWTWREDEHAVELARAGLLVSDEPGEPFERLRRRDRELTDLGWHPAAAAFHLATRWEGTRVAVLGRDGARPRRARRPGPPLPPFHERGGERVALPPAALDGPLEGVLRARRTARSFGDDPVGLGELATLLASVWGAHGSAPLARGDTALRKTSPSGGGLHPIEVYPLVRRVAGLASGVYHYRVGDHALERLAPLDSEEATALLQRATAGQWYFADADVAFVLTARFGRCFWKYRRHAKAFRALLLDAGHLSQTFYLVCTQLGLGPFVTAAIDDAELERALGLDPLLEAPLALCGCGRATVRRNALEPSFGER